MELQQLAILKFSKGEGWVSESQQEAYRGVSQVRAILEEEDEVASFYTHGSIFPKLCTWTRHRLCRAAKPHQEEGFARPLGRTR